MNRTGVSAAASGIAGRALLNEDHGDVRTAGAHQPYFRDSDDHACRAGAAAATSAPIHERQSNRAQAGRVVVAPGFTWKL